MSDVEQKVRDFIDVHQDNEDWYDTEIEVGELRVICHSWLELKSERDEARARIAVLEEAVYWRAEAEQRGYLKGVEDAGFVAVDFAQDRMGTLSKSELRAAIFALLEQTSDSNRPHLETGAGSAEKI